MRVVVPDPRPWNRHPRGAATGRGDPGAEPAHADTRPNPALTEVEAEGAELDGAAEEESHGQLESDTRALVPLQRRHMPLPGSKV